MNRILLSPFFCLILILCVHRASVVQSHAASADGTVVHVRTDGVDDVARDARSEATAWASLAFACEHLPAGAQTIQLGAGTFIATRTARIPAGVTVAGSGSTGEKATQLVAAPDWKVVPDLRKANPTEEYLIAVQKAEGVVIRDLMLASDAAHRITGGVFATGAKQLELAGLQVREFRWAGLHVEHSSGVNLHDCRIENASLEKHGARGGLIRTKWLKDSEIHHNVIVGGKDDGYGYKGGGHENVKLHHNVITAPYFAIESAHENEFGVEVHHNRINGCVSIPKGGQAADPNTRGFAFSFWVHDNVLTDSYTVEGPRNHLRLDHNYIRIEKPGGRVYTQHGGKNNGPVWIHHNVIENVDRSFIYMNEGLAENIQVFNNTVTFADAGERTGGILSAYTGERLNGWQVRNNVFICPESNPRPLLPLARGVPDKITATHNLLIHVNGAPAGNVSATAADFTAQGDKPWPYYAPKSGGNLVDAGMDVGLPFKGAAPDLGAYEQGETTPLRDIPSAQAP